MEALGYATDRATTRRRIARGDFPPPVILSSNSVAWIAAEVRDNAANRPRGLAPQPPRQRPSTAPVTLSAVGRSRGVA
jgi:predicted DNA-binding transcriptional regulator AlpA